MDWIPVLIFAAGYVAGMVVTLALLALIRRH
jgi:hypothetical protein